MITQPRRPLRTGLFLAILLAIAATPIRADDWPMFGNTPQRSFASTENLPGPLHLRWSIRLPPLEPAWLDQPRVRTDAAYHPIVVGARVIVASSHDDSLAAYEILDGRLAWRFFTGGPIRYAPAAENNRIFVGSDDGCLYALSAADGQLLWKLKPAPKHRPVLGNGRIIDTWCIRGGPVVEKRKVYFAAGIWPFMGVFVACADAATGKILWCNSGDGSTFMKQPHSALSFGSLAPQGPLAIAGERLLVPNGRSMPASLERDTGRFQYFNLNNKVGGDRVSAGGTWFFDFGQGYDPESGNLVATIATVSGSPVFAGDMAYTVGTNELRTFELNNPDITPAKLYQKGVRKRIPVRKLEFPGVRCIAAAGQRLYAGGDGWVAAADLPLTDKKVKPQWKHNIEGAVADLVPANGCLLVTTEQGAIHCFAGGVNGRSPSVTPFSDPVRAVPPASHIHTILADSAISSGYAVVLGASGEPAARQLAASGMTHVIVLESNPTQADALRRRLQNDYVYGRRIAVIVGDLSAETPPLPPCFASLVVADKSSPVRSTDAAAQAIFRLLHPYHGAAYLPGDAAWREPLAAVAARQDPARAQLGQINGFVRLARRGGLPGAGSWTHENADPANTRISADTLAKAPLGVLWFGGSSHEGILPRHGHGPQPQVAGGRILIQGMELLRALDAYTGRVLWESPLPGVGAFYNHTAHNPGANGTGSNFVSLHDAIYVAIAKQCVRLEPATGRQLSAFALPQIKGITPESVWSFISVSDDFLIGGASPPSPGPGAAKEAKDPEDRDDDPLHPKRAITSPRTVGSRILFVMERQTGKLLWSRAATVGEFRHNATCIGGGRLYTIDRPIATPPRLLGFLEPDDGPEPKLFALDLATGRQLWTVEKEVFGTWLSYSQQHDVLVEAGRVTRDMLRDEPRGMRAYQGASGLVRWFDPKARGPAMIRGDWAILEGAALDLRTGKPTVAPDPLTGSEIKWSWTRNYGCNTPAGSINLLTFRSGAAGFYDLARNGGTGNFGGFRSSCTNNLIVADGLICSPDYTRTCTCSFPLQTSVALIPDADVEMWTYQAASDAPGKRVRRVGINFGAPGDRIDDSGTLWMEYPSSAGKSPKLEVKTEPEDVSYFRQHASTVTGPLPWVAASGALGISNIKVRIGGDDTAPRPYTVRLYFLHRAAENQPSVMDVFIQGTRIEAALNIPKAANSPDRTLVREYRHVQIGKRLAIDLKSTTTAPTLICGLEVIEEPRK